MSNNNLQVEFKSKVISLFLGLAQAPLRQLLNQCQLSVGLKAGESTLLIDSNSVLDIEILWQEQAWYLALAAEILGIRRILISHRGETFYAFSVGLLLSYPE